MATKSFLSKEGASYMLSKLAAWVKSYVNGEVKVKEVKVNGTALTPDSNKAVDVTVPTIATNSTVGVNVTYKEGNANVTKTIYDKEHVEAYVDSKVGSITGMEIVTRTFAEGLPTTGEAGKIYLMPISADANAPWAEYVWVNKGTASAPSYTFEELGIRTDIDLSGYATKQELEAYAKTTDLDAYAKTTDLDAYLKETDVIAITNAEIDAMFDGTTGEPKTPSGS